MKFLVFIIVILTNTAFAKGQFKCNVNNHKEFKKQLAVDTLDWLDKVGVKLYDEKNQPVDVDTFKQEYVFDSQEFISIYDQKNGGFFNERKLVILKVADILTKSFRVHRKNFVYKVVYKSLANSNGETCVDTGVPGQRFVISIDSIELIQ